MESISEMKNLQKCMDMTCVEGDISKIHKWSLYLPKKRDSVI